MMTTLETLVKEFSEQSPEWSEVKFIVEFSLFQSAVNALFNRERGSSQATGDVGSALDNVGLRNLILLNKMHGNGNKILSEDIVASLPAKMSWIARDIGNIKAALEELYTLVEGLDGSWPDRVKADIERLLA